MTEPWQEIARELGTYDCGYSDRGMLEPQGDLIGAWMCTEPACQRIAELEAEVARLRAEFRKPLGLEVVRTERKTEPAGGAS